MAEDREIQRHEAPRAPLSAHPAFPLIVGLWFAALLGLGTMVMPAVVLEKLTSATGLTEPPLTAAARAAVALVATIVGLAGGLALARRLVAAQQADRPPRRRAPTGANPPVRPLSVHDDLGEEAIGAAAADKRPAIPGRRRALAVIEDERPSDFLMAAPVPGDDRSESPQPTADEDAMSERPSDFEVPTDGPPADEAFDAPASAAQAAEPAPPAAAQVFEPAAELSAPAPYVPDLDTRKPRDLAAPPPPAPEAADEADELVVEPIDAPLEDLGVVQLAERLGRSMQRRLARPRPAPAADASPPADTLEFSAPSLDHGEPAQAPLAVPPPVVPDALRAFMDVEPAGPVPQPETSVAAVEQPPRAMPAALQPLGLDQFDLDDDDEHDPGPFTLPFDTAATRAPAASAEPGPAFAAHDSEISDEDEGEEPLADEGYSSLLSIKNPFRAEEEFVRVEEPDAEDGAVEPAVVFPAQEPVAAEPPAPAAADAEIPEGPNPARPFDAPHQPAPSTAPPQARKAPDPVETERALRSALANLQRMSGAA